MSLATVTCPSCGADVPVSDALFCPFCGQALRKVLATQPPSSDTSAPTFAPAPSASGVQAMWTPYPEQATLHQMQAPAPPGVPTPPPAVSAPGYMGTPYLSRPVGAIPGERSTVHAGKVIGATLAVIVLSALGVLFNVRLAQQIEGLAHNRAFFFYLVYLIPLASVALAGSYWIAWARLPVRQTSRVLLEAFVFSFTFLVVARTISDFVFFHVFVPNSYGTVDPLAWLKYIFSNRASIGWILALSAVASVAGVLFAATCADWSSQRRKASNSAGLALAGVLLCLTLYVATIDVVDKWNAKSIFIHNIFTFSALVAVAPVTVAVLAAMQGVRRLRRT